MGYPNAKSRSCLGEDVELQTELIAKLVLPLLHQATGSNDKAALEITASDKFFDKEARHNGLARPGNNPLAKS